MTKSALSPEQFATAHSLNSRTVIVNGSSVTFILERMTDGKARIRVCWNQTQITETDPSGASIQVWDFDEWVLSWVPAPTFVQNSVTVATMATTSVNGKEVIDEGATLTNVADYIAANAEEILGYAKSACYLTNLSTTPR